MTTSISIVPNTSRMYCYIKSTIPGAKTEKMMNILATTSDRVQSDFHYKELGLLEFTDAALFKVAIVEARATYKNDYQKHFCFFTVHDDQVYELRIDEK